MLVYCWPTVYDAGPTINQHCFNVLCLLGKRYIHFTNFAKPPDGNLVGPSCPPKCDRLPLACRLNAASIRPAVSPRRSIAGQGGKLHVSALCFRPICLLNMLSPFLSVASALNSVGLNPCAAVTIYSVSRTFQTRFRETQLRHRNRFEWLCIWREKCYISQSPPYYIVVDCWVKTSQIKAI